VPVLVLHGKKNIAPNIDRRASKSGSGMTLRSRIVIPIICTITTIRTPLDVIWGAHSLGYQLKTSFGIRARPLF
jgi:hypothetical protein